MGADEGGRIVQAYEQVAAQLRKQILDGLLVEGARLSNETVLAADDCVSRSTVREAFRLLGAQSLIRTAKGAAAART